jgi:integrase
MAAKRKYGTGSLFVKDGSWVGQWRVDGRQVKRTVGPVKRNGSRTGMSRTQAEKALRELMVSTLPVPVKSERATVRRAGDELIAKLEAKGRKKATIDGYRSVLTNHLEAFFKTKPLDTIQYKDVERLIAHLIREGKSVKTALNTAKFLHSVFRHAQREGWVRENPVPLADRPLRPPMEKLEALSVDELVTVRAAVPGDEFGKVERVLYLAAFTTGLRMGELLALRWCDILWTVDRIRVERNYSRGEFTTPKSDAGSRSVPVATWLAQELAAWEKVTRYSDADDLVFAHPELGTPLDRSKVTRRWKLALKAAKVKEVRFHDLRHAYATHLAMQAGSLDAITQVMGHSDPRVTEIYRHRMANPLEKTWADAAFQAPIQASKAA